MNRRAFLTSMGVISLSGCTQLTGGPRTVTVTKIVVKTPEPTPTQTASPTPTPTDSPTPTPTESPEPDPPDSEISTVALISGWKEFGDVLDNRISSITTDENPMIGARFSVACGPEREVRWRNYTTVRNNVGDAVASESANNQEFTNNCYNQSMTVEWEQAVTLNYDNEFGTNWPAGTYTAEVRIDDFHGQMSVSEDTTFEVVSA